MQVIYRPYDNFLAKRPAHEGHLAMRSKGGIFFIKINAIAIKQKLLVTSDINYFYSNVYKLRYGGNISRFYGSRFDNSVVQVPGVECERMGSLKHIAFVVLIECSVRIFLSEFHAIYQFGHVSRQYLVRHLDLKWTERIGKTRV